MLRLTNALNYGFDLAFQDEGWGFVESRFCGSFERGHGHGHGQGSGPPVGRLGLFPED